MMSGCDDKLMEKWLAMEQERLETYNRGGENSSQILEYRNQR